MSKLGCPCGNTISDVACPNVRKAFLVTDGEKDEVCGAYYDANELERALEKFEREVFLCGECGRLLVQWDPEKNNFDSYAPEGVPRLLIKPEVL